MKESIGKSFVLLGAIFLIIGFVQQEFTLSFESGMFNIGLIFLLSGLLASILKKKQLKN